MRRRGHEESGGVSSPTGDNDKSRRASPAHVLGGGLLLLVAAYSLLMRAPQSGGAERETSALMRDGGGVRLADKALRGDLGAGVGLAAEAACKPGHADFRPGAAGDWTLTDEALPGEGIRLELVTTLPYGTDAKPSILSPADKSSFCEAFEESSVHMQRTGILHRGDRSPKKAARGLSRADMGVEGTSKVACARTSFYLVDQEDTYSDKIVDFVRGLWARGDEGESCKHAPL